MIAPVEKTINGRVVSVAPLPAMQALRLWPLASRGIGTGFAGLSADEMQQLTKALLATVRLDGKELMGGTFDLDLAGDINFVLMELLPLAFEVNYGAKGDFSDAAPAPDAAAASPSATSST